jgi:hypothetical protein
MDFNKTKFVYLFIMGVLITPIINSSCGNKDNCFVYHQVTFPFNMYAKSDTISLGDTVSIELAFPRRLKEVLYDDYLYLPKDFFRHVVSIIKIDKDSIELNNLQSSTGDIFDFNAIALVGELSYTFGSYNQHIDYLITEDSVFGDFKFIALDTGTYVFYLSDFAYYNFRDDLPYALSNTECYESYWHGLMLNENPDNNYYIIKKHQVHFDTLHVQYFDVTQDGVHDLNNPNARHSVNDDKKNLRYGTFSVVVN